MGAIFPVLDKEVEGIDISTVSGKMINRYEPELSEILVNNGLKSIMDFFGGNPLDYLDEEEFEDIEIPEDELVEKWFEPKDGLKFVQFLISHLQKTSDFFGEETKDVIEDLEDFESVLKKAQIANAKWHIEIEI